MNLSVKYFGLPLTELKAPRSLSLHFIYFKAASTLEKEEPYNLKDDDVLNWSFSNVPAPALNSVYSDFSFTIDKHLKIYILSISNLMS